MPTQPDTEQSPQSATEPGEGKSSPLDYCNRAEIALRDMDSLFIAALCVVRMEGKYSDMSDDDKKQALETLMEYGRGAVDDAKRGLEELWHVTAGYLYGKKREALNSVSSTEQREGD